MCGETDEHILVTIIRSTLKNSLYKYLVVFIVFNHEDRVCVLSSAPWHVVEESRPGQSSVCLRGSRLQAVHSISNPRCLRPATPTSAHRLRRKVLDRMFFCFVFVFYFFALPFVSEINTPNCTIFLLSSSQILHVEITSAGVTWCPSMESATTSSMASSAAIPVQTQIYSHTNQLFLRHWWSSSLKKKQNKKQLYSTSTLWKDCIVLSVWRALKHRGHFSGSAVAVPFLLPGMPDIWMQELDAVSTTHECDQRGTMKGGIVRRNLQNGHLD